MKVLSLVGARPQFIKAAITCEAFKKNGIQEVLVNSGQHYDSKMSDIFFQVLQLPEPAYNLNVGSGKHGQMTAKIMDSFEPVLEKENPDVVLVFGDTNTTLAGALVAAKMKIKIAHVEAGIRMLPKDMPEEINRVLVDRISSFMFCPTTRGLENLKREGITEGVYFTGDVMFDLFSKMKPLFNDKVVSQLSLAKENYAVATLHRDYNVDHEDRLKALLLSLQKLNDRLPVVLPLHPRTAKRIKEFNLEKLIEKLRIIEPVDYLEMMGLISNSKVVITDSGGLQKESYFAGKHAVVLMPDTGWQELVDCGVNKLAEPETLGDQVLSFSSYQDFPKGLFGEGNAGDKICQELLRRA